VTALPSEKTITALRKTIPALLLNVRLNGDSIIADKPQLSKPSLERVFEIRFVFLQAV
jgi:hypothetical protein